MATTIQISDEVRDKLKKMKLFERESYNETIERILEDNMELNTQTKKEIEAARKRVKQGKFVRMSEVKKRYGI